MSKLLRLLMFVWAFPATLLGMVYAAPMDVIFGWFKYLGKRGNAIVWCVNEETTPKWALWAWNRHNAHVLGNVVVLRHYFGDERSAKQLRHEQEHVEQWMTWGIFMPMAYWCSWVVLHTAKHAHPVWDHPMEIDARRAAGQIVDVVGALKRLALQGKLQIRHHDVPHE